MNGVEPRERVRVLVDDREKTHGLVPAIAGLVGDRLTLTRLVAGDIRIGEAYLIERKTAADFVASLLDGRLEHQLAALAGVHPAQALLIIEGSFTPAVLGGLAPAEARRALLSIALDWRIPCLHAATAEETARWVALLVERVERPGRPFAGDFAAAEEVVPPPTARFSGRRAGAGAHAVQQAALRRIPGLGARRAEALLRRFGSISALARATEAEITATPGIGPELAAAVRRALAMPPPP